MIKRIKNIAQLIYYAWKLRDILKETYWLRVNLKTKMVILNNSSIPKGKALMVYPGIETEDNILWTNLN